MSGAANQFPPIQNIPAKTHSVQGWWDSAYRAAERHVKGWDLELDLKASSGGYSFSESGVNSGKRVTATLSVPLYSRKERMALHAKRYEFMQKGLSLIREAKELAHILVIQHDNLKLIRALIQVEGVKGVKALSTAQAEIIRNEQRMWEIETLFNELVRQ